MARKRSDEIVTRIIRQRQKNGDIYVIERKCKYNPEKKYNVVLSSRIVGKIPLGQDQVVPARPKRPNGEKVSISDHPLIASRMRVGMMDIIDHIGKVSGIDDRGFPAVRADDIAVFRNGSLLQDLDLHFFQSSVSRMIVTGPSLTIRTSISSPNSPVFTSPMPAARSSSQNRR